MPSILTFLLMFLVTSLLVLLFSSRLFVLLPLLALFLRCLLLLLRFFRLLLLSPAPPFSAPSSVFVPSLGSLADPQGWGVSALGVASVVSSALPGFPPLSAPSSLLSVPPPAVSASPPLPPDVSMLPTPSSSLSPTPSVLFGLSVPALGSSPVVLVVSQLPPGPQPSPFCPFTVSDPPLSFASASAQLSSVSHGSTAGPSGFPSTASSSVFGQAGFAPQPGPSSAFPPLSSDSVTPSAPPLRICLPS